MNTMNEEESNLPSVQESTSPEPEPIFYGMPFSEFMHRLKLNWNERVVPNLWYAPEGCILWRGGHSTDGYPAMRLGLGKVQMHIATYMYVTGVPIPTGMHVCHKCDVPGCMNFEHLFLGTRFDNMQDMAQKGRKAKNYFSKLTTQQILDIKQLLREGKLTQTQIAKKFYVGQATISEIKNDRRPLFAGTKAIAKTGSEY